VRHASVAVDKEIPYNELFVFKDLRQAILWVAYTVVEIVSWHLLEYIPKSKSWKSARMEINCVIDQNIDFYQNEKMVFSDIR